MRLVGYVASAIWSFVAMSLSAQPADASLLVFSEVASPQQKVESMKSPSSRVESTSIDPRFRGVSGGELRVDSLFYTNKVVIINVDTGYLFNVGMGVFTPRGATVSGYGGVIAGDRLAIPKFLRMMRFPDHAKFLSADRPPYFEGSPLVDVIVPIAERIPDETLDDLRRNGGGLRLKLRIHPDTLLVGWDIVRRPGYDSAHKDALGNPVHVPLHYSAIGGDFCERQVWTVEVDGRLQRIEKKGWYIDPGTKQRIETEF